MRRFISRMEILMKMITLLFSLALGVAQASPNFSKEDFCQLAKNPKNFQLRLLTPESRIAFQNPSGPLHMGSCWWHAQLQRSATYLAVFRPELPPPSRGEMDLIIQDLIEKRRVVEIPGYGNFHELTEDWEPLFVLHLDDWQLKDLFQRWKWLHAVNPAKVSAKRFRKTMDKLYESVEGKKRITFIAVRIEAHIKKIHGMLVTQMKKTDSGYEIKYVDSNEPDETGVYVYEDGDSEFPTLSVGDGAPFVQQNGDFDDYAKAISDYCGQRQR
jgi:hypothetical protein